MAYIDILKKKAESESDEERKKRIRKSILFSIIPSIILIIFFCVGIGFIVRGVNPSAFIDKSFVATKATVVDISYDASSDGGTLPYPVYQFQFDGEEYKIKSRVSVSPSPFKVGDVITIYVNPNKPTDIVTPISNRFFLIFGMVAALLSFVAFSINIGHTLLDIFPKSDLVHHLCIRVPLMIFLWSIVIFAISQIKSPQKSLGGFLVPFVFALFLVVFAMFITVNMIIQLKEDIGYASRNKKKKINTGDPELDKRVEAWRDQQQEEYKKRLLEINNNNDD